MDVVGEGAVEVPLNEFAVVFAEFAGIGAAEEAGVEVRVLGEEGVAAGVMEPGGAAPGWWDAFADEALRFGRSLGKGNGFAS